MRECLFVVNIHHNLWKRDWQSSKLNQLTWSIQTIFRDNKIHDSLLNLIIMLSSLYDERYVRSAFFFKTMEGFLEAGPQLALQVNNTISKKAFKLIILSISGTVTGLNWLIWCFQWDCQSKMRLKWNYIPLNWNLIVFVWSYWTSLTTIKNINNNRKEFNSNSNKLWYFRWVYCSEELWQRAVTWCCSLPCRKFWRKIFRCPSLLPGVPFRQQLRIPLMFLEGSTIQVGSLYKTTHCLMIWLLVWQNIFKDLKLVLLLKLLVKWSKYHFVQVAKPF